jgi:hypothetical protein
MLGHIGAGSTTKTIFTEIWNLNSLWRWKIWNEVVILLMFYDWIRGGSEH